MARPYLWKLSTSNSSSIITSSNNYFLKSKAMTKKESKSPPSKQQIDLELEKAIASVTVVQTRTEQLHSQWRNQLVRLSCLVMLLSLHQCSQPALECVNDIKAQEMGSSQSLWATSQRVVGHSMMEVMGVLISFLLFRFTSMNDPPGDFSSQPYVAAASLIPFCAGNLYQCGL